MTDFARAISLAQLRWLAVAALSQEAAILQNIRNIIREANLLPTMSPQSLSSTAWSMPASELPEFTFNPLTLFFK